MAVPTGTFQTFAAIGENEDLEQDIYDISPTDTPFMSSIGRGKASNVLHEWQTDALATATKDNINVEGDDAATSTASPTTRFGNYCQILQKTPRVTGTLRATSTAGRSDEYSYNVAKRAKELKRDLEMSFLSKNGGEAGDAASARQLAGAGAWLWDNQVQIATSTVATVSSGVPGANTAVADNGATPTEGNLSTLLEYIWDDGGDPTVIYCDGTNKKNISSNFSGIATQYRENKGMAQATILGAADVYISDFGELSIVADRFCDTQTVYAMDLDYWEAAYLRPMQTNPLAKTGDSDRAQLLCEVTLVAKNPSASGLIGGTA